MSISFGIYFESPFLAIDVEGFTVLESGKLVSLIIKFVCVVNVLGINLVSKWGSSYSVVKDLRLKLNSYASL